MLKEGYKSMPVKQGLLHLPFSQDFSHSFFFIYTTMLYIAYADEIIWLLSILLICKYFDLNSH